MVRNSKRLVWESRKTKARKWFREAAKQGYSPAQFTLGIIYRIGKDIPGNETESRRWKRKAAEWGHVVAQLIVAVKYLQAWGVKMDSIESLKWLLIAGKRENETSDEREFWNRALREMTLGAGSVGGKACSGFFLEEQ